MTSGLLGKVQNSVMMRNVQAGKDAQTPPIDDDGIEKALRELSASASISLCTELVNAVHKKRRNGQRGEKPEWWPDDIPYDAPSHVRAPHRPKLIRTVLRLPDLDLNVARRLETLVSSSNRSIKTQDLGIIRRVVAGAVRGKRMAFHLRCVRCKYSGC